MARTQGNGTPPARPIEDFKKEIELRLPMFQAMLPAHVDVDKFKVAVITAVGNNPKLLEAERGSLFKAAMEAADLGLSLNPQRREAVILPVYNRRTQRFEAQFRPEYIGLMKLARQSGEVTNIYAHVVHEADTFRFEYGLKPDLVHVPAREPRGDRTYAYCVWTLKDGTTAFEVMSRDDILAIRDRSQAKDKDGNMVGPWVTDESEMWRKTVVRRASKYMPLSAEEFQRAARIDDLREAGESVSVSQGEIITDITDIEMPPEEKAEVKPAAAKQVDELARKIAPQGAAGTQPPTARTKAPPDINEGTVPFMQVPRDERGQDNYMAWADAAVELLAGKPKSWRDTWGALHSKALQNLEFTNPDVANRVRKSITG